MEYSQVNIVLGYSEIQALRPLLLSFRQTTSSFPARKITSENYKDKILVSFNVDTKIYMPIVEKFRSNNITVIDNIDGFEFGDVNGNSIGNIAEDETFELKI